MIDADVSPAVLVVNDSQEEQLTAGQQHAVRARVLIGRHDRLSVAVPRDDRRRVALRLTVERCRFVLGDVLVVRVFDNARVCDAVACCRDIAYTLPQLLLRTTAPTNQIKSNEINIYINGSKEKKKKKYHC